MDVEAHLRAIFFEQMEGPDAFHQGSPRRSRRIVKRQADAADTALIAQATESQEMAYQDRAITRSTITKTNPQAIKPTVKPVWRDRLFVAVYVGARQTVPNCPIPSIFDDQIC